MTDIVWKLRNDVPCISDIGCAWELCNQAADEIERMISGVVMMESAMSQQIETIWRLRAALREIARYETAALQGGRDDQA